MPSIVVHDASCLFDLRKGRLLGQIKQLPHQFVIPLPIRTDEILDFTAQEWRTLDNGGMKTHDLPAKEMRQAERMKQQYGALSAHDCLALVTALSHRGSILLTGDALLRKVAGEKNIEVHGILWIIDELHREESCETELLVTALQIWMGDRSVFLPEEEIEQRIRALQGKSG